MNDVKEYQKNYQKEYRKKNKDKLNEYQKKYRKKWEIENKDKIKEYREITKERLKNDPERQEKYREYRREYRRKYYAKYKSKYTLKRTVRLKKQRLKNPDKFHLKDRKNQLKKKYGITIEMYDNLYEQQKGLCKICLKQKEKKDRYLHIDHCHKTGKVRGLLCRKCNWALGLINDDITILNNMKKYLTN